MRLRVYIGAAFMAALVFPTHGLASPPPKQHRIGLVLHDNVSLRTKPRNDASVISVLVEQTQVEVLKTRPAWQFVRIWASVTGWIPSREVVFRKPWLSTSTYRAPVVHYHVHAYAPRSLNAACSILQSTSILSSPGGRAVGSHPAGSATISAWQQDATGSIWYRVGPGWIPSTYVRLVTPNPATEQVGGSPLWQQASGKGMWITLGPIAQTRPSAIVKAARDAGIQHLYLESAISPLGFHGKKSVGPLIDEAHANGIKVIAWVYPYLYDIASDVELTRKVADFRTLAGNRFDGIAADLERNMTAPAIGAYSQLVRAYVGPHYLLVGVTYPPQSLPTYPFGEVGRSYNVIAPMDYWHQTAASYGLDYGHMKYSQEYARRYVADSVAVIRRMSPGSRIAPIGQTFDNFGHEEMGPNAPSAEEIQGSLQGGKSSGAIGMSFFQWMTATDPEWKTIQRYRF